jgi:hypothetical protein
MENEVAQDDGKVEQSLRNQDFILGVDEQIPTPRDIVKGSHT